MTNLYEAIGGQKVVSAAVYLFYEKVLADERISHFFKGVDMGRLRQHRKTFLATAFGSKLSYSGRSLREAYQALVECKGLNDSRFDAIIYNLASTLSELGVATYIVESTRADVLDQSKDHPSAASSIASTWQRALL